MTSNLGMSIFKGVGKGLNLPSSSLNQTDSRLTGIWCPKMGVDRCSTPLARQQQTWMCLNVLLHPFIWPNIEVQRKVFIWPLAEAMGSEMIEGCSCFFYRMAALRQAAVFPSLHHWFSCPFGPPFFHPISRSMIMKEVEGKMEVVAWEAEKNLYAIWQLRLTRRVAKKVYFLLSNANNS